MAQQDNSELIRITWILYAIGGLAAVMRLSIKLYLSRRFSIEEYAMATALILWAVQTGMIQFIANHGTNQVDVPSWREQMSDEEHENRVVGAKVFISAWFVYITEIWLCKSAILQLQTRITERIQQRKAMIWMRYVLIASYAACALSLFCLCRPFHNNWKIRPDPGKKCTDGVHYAWIVGVMNIITDICLIILPIPVLLTLRVSLNKKILLIALFTLGIFVVVATILRIYFTIAGGNIASMTFWAQIESTTLFIVSNAPGIRPLFVHKSPSASTAASRNAITGSSKNNYGMGNYKPTITTLVAAGDSQEHIVDNPMIIMQTVGYDVTVEAIDADSGRGSGRASPVQETDGGKV